MVTTAPTGRCVRWDAHRGPGANLCAGEPQPRFEQPHPTLHALPFQFPQEPGDCCATQGFMERRADVPRLRTMVRPADVLGFQRIL